MTLILASASPRRNELLLSLGAPFRVEVADIDESHLPGERIAEVCLRLAYAKATAIASNFPDSVVIGADTLVGLGEDSDVILGKPRDVAQAVETLKTLSGREHVVVTGVCVIAEGRAITAVEASHVKFRALRLQEIDAYVSTGEPMDKAGAYAIQGGAADFVEAVHGSWSNIVGLPLERLREMLSEVNFDLNQ